MYILKNAMRSISRSKGRNILIGIIALVIAVSACIALSIKEAALKAKEDTLASMEITAQISVDRQSMMSSATQDGSFDRDAMKEMLQGNNSLTLEEYETYSKAESVKNFYYNISASLDAGGDIEPVDTAGTFSSDSSSSSSSTDSDSSKSQGNMPQMPQDSGGKGFGKMGSQGDFTIVGYSSDKAMTGFVDGTSSIEDGNVFAEGTQNNDCIITDELASYNNLSVGDTITLLNPNKEEETVTLNIVGIYSNTSTDDGDTMGGFNTASDAANKIYMSYTALKAIVDTSAASATETTDEDSGRTTTDAISSQLTATYVFDGIEDYESFCDEVKDMGLSDTFTVSSSNLSSFEQSLTPLENLSKMSDYFLIVVFAIGAVILVVLNIFNIRERKYEIGVMTAIGMKKIKVAMQFIFELFVITLSAIILGAGIGAATSVPVTNALLSTQIASNQASTESVQQNFGRAPGANTGTNGGSGLTTPPSGTQGSNIGSKGGFMSGFMGKTTDYISEISYSTDISVILKLILVGIGLTVISSLAAVCFIMRYEPLKILTSRD